MVDIVVVFVVVFIVVVVVVVAIVVVLAFVFEFLSFVVFDGLDFLTVVELILFLLTPELLDISELSKVAVPHLGRLRLLYEAIKYQIRIRNLTENVFH